MFRKSLILLVVLLVVVAATSVLAGTYSNTTPGGVDSGAFTRTVVVSGEATLTDVNIAVQFNNVDGSGCHLNPIYSLSNELSMTLQSPAGTTVNLVNQNTFTWSMSGVANPTTITFDDEAASALPTIPTNGTFRAVGSLAAFDGEDPNGIWTLTFSDNVGADDSCFYSMDLILGAAAGRVPTFTDGRLNNQDQWQTFAVYCASHDIEVYAIDAAGLGQVAFVATPDEVATVTQFPAQNTVIDSGRGVTLYRVVTGELQVVGPADFEGKIYNVQFLGCPSYPGDVRTWVGF